MARRGRKPTGANLVERLEGSERAKTRLKAILETLSGQRTIPDACEELGIQESMFHRVRCEVLQTALDRLEPRPLGRPPQQPSPQDRRIAELEEENRRLQVELKAAEIRRELAENLPRLAKSQSGKLGRGAGEKNDCSVAELPSQTGVTSHQSPHSMNPSTCQSPRRGRSLHRARPARRSAASRGLVLVAPEYLAAATRRRNAGRTDSQASWAEGQPRCPLDRREPAAQREKPNGWRPSSAKPRRSSRSKKNSRRCWGFPCRRPTTAGASHEGHRRTFSAGGHGSGLPQLGRASGDALSASSAEAARACDHATAHAAAGAERAGAATGPRRAPQRAVCRQGSGRGLCGTFGPGPVSLLDPHDVPHPGLPARKSASDATNCGTRPTTSRNWWPPRPIRSGPGTSPSCWGRRNGPTSTCT